MKNYNTYDLTGKYGIGYDIKGNEFYFDLEDYDKIKEYYWHVAKTNYVMCSKKPNGFGFLHNFLMGFKGIDHKNRKRNDNRKENLRAANPTQNGQNKSMQRNNHQVPNVVGVYYRGERNSWYAQITVNKKTKTLIYTHDMEEAIKARLKAEKEYFGEFAPQQHLFEKYGIE